MGVNGVDPLGLALYAFDGTGNHQFGWNLYDGVRGPSATRNYKTNVRLFYEAYSDINGKKFYVPGIGSGYGPDGTEYNRNTKKNVNRYEGATGNTMWSRASFMKERLEEQLQAGDNVVDLVGFSRGSATGLVFLNMISDEIAKGNKLYENIEIRFVGLFDAVSSMRGNTGDDKRLENDSRWFRLPESFKVNDYKNTPIHAISLDEQRAEFQQIDINGAYQIGFRGVHSNIGGGYAPGDPFAWHAFDYMVDRAKVADIEFKTNEYAKVPRPGKSLYDKWSSAKGFDKFNYLNPTRPYDNSSIIYNDEEQRAFPRWNCYVHPSAGHFSSPHVNKYIRR